VPRPIGAARRFRGLLRSDAALAELSISWGSSFPLFPDHRPKSTSEPLPQFLKHAWGFASPEVADPSAEIFRYIMDHPGETYPSCPTRKFPNSLLESHDRFRRQAPLRLLVIREAESQEFPFPWSSHRALRTVHSQLELRREESRHAAHHSFTGPPTADVDVAIIRISCEPMSASLQLLIQFVEYDVR
jgi:hypothetical protein